MCPRVDSQPASMIPIAMTTEFTLAAGKCVRQRAVTQTQAPSVPGSAEVSRWPAVSHRRCAGQPGR